MSRSGFELTSPAGHEDARLTTKPTEVGKRVRKKGEPKDRPKVRPKDRPKVRPKDRPKMRRKREEVFQLASESINIVV